MLEWEAVRSEFEWDGSLRDLYVFETSEADWDRFLAGFVRGRTRRAPQLTASRTHCRNQHEPPSKSAAALFIFYISMSAALGCAATFSQTKSLSLISTSGS